VDADVVRVDAASLYEFYVAAFERSGLPAAAARTAAESLSYADLHGFDTHGAASLDGLYLRMLRDGTVCPTAVPEVVESRPAAATVDAHNALGFVAARFGMEEAIRLARRCGVGAVAVRRSSHCGSMGHYARLAADAGLVGMALTNLGAQRILRPLGGSRRLLGTNVVAAGAPTASTAPFVLDMSTAVVAAGRIKAAVRAGQRVPDGWLVDDAGRTVSDPQAYYDGRAHLQFVGGGPATGGHKGYGLAVLVDVLAGALSGARVGPSRSDLDSASGREDDDIGHFFLALDPSAFGPVASFLDRMDDMLEALASSEPAGDARRVLYPGLVEAETAVERGANGVPVARRVFEELLEVASRLRIEAPPKRRARRT
jgi:LDH2 family malate/lactate/ureidoglycolate dehydrogenase